MVLVGCSARALLVQRRFQSTTAILAHVPPSSAGLDPAGILQSLSSCDSEIWPRKQSAASHVACPALLGQKRHPHCVDTTLEVTMPKPELDIDWNPDYPRPASDSDISKARPLYYRFWAEAEALLEMFVSQPLLVIRASPIHRAVRSNCYHHRHSLPRAASCVACVVTIRSADSIAE